MVIPKASMLAGKAGSIRSRKEAACRRLLGGEGVGGAHGRNEFADLAGVLDALGGLHAGTHVNGQRLATRPQHANAIADVGRRQPTRQDEVSVCDVWKE